MESNKQRATLQRPQTRSPRLKYAGLLAALLVVVSLLVGPSTAPVHAASFIVDTTADTVDIAPGNGVCASYVEGGCSLRAAIMEANALQGADIIDVPAGTYTLSMTGAGEDLGATGDLDITSDITITGAGSGSTLIDGNNADRVLEALAGTISLSGLTLRNGLAPASEGGGGLSVQSDADVTADDVVITSNTVSFAEGVSAGGIYVAGTLALNNSQVLNNVAQFGGGIYNSGVTTIDQTTIAGNADDAAFGGAGGILNNGEILTISRSAIVSNTNGGLIHYGGPATLENVTVSANTGFGLTVSAAGISVSHSTIAYNGASGITLEGGTPTLDHTIIYGHTAECSDPITSNGYNLAGDASCGLIPTDFPSADPALGTLANNGGLTLTHALLPGSEALDAGDPAFSPPPSTDQRGPGFLRIAGGNIDIGAYESTPTDPPQYYDLIVNTADDLDDGTCSVAHCSLREALNAVGYEAVINFDIPGSGPSGPHIIQPTSPLPDLRSDVTLCAAGDGCYLNTDPDGIRPRRQPRRRRCIRHHRARWLRRRRVSLFNGR